MGRTKCQTQRCRQEQVREQEPAERSPPLQPGGSLKAARLVLLPERLSPRPAREAERRGPGRHGLCRSPADGRAGGRACYRLIRTPGLQAPCPQRESTHQQLATRRRVSLSAHWGLHAPGDAHIRSRCLFRVYPPPFPPSRFLLPVRPSWADSSSHYLTK